VRTFSIAGDRSATASTCRAVMLPALRLKRRPVPPGCARGELLEGPVLPNPALLMTW